MIERVGIVAKTGLTAAADLLVQIAGWLEARHVEPVFEVDTAALAAGGPGGRRTGTRQALPSLVDLVLVLGGDGTLLGMADRIAQAGREIPILGVNFGSLGFLTEITLPELYPSLESVLAGTADIDNRLMLRATVRGADGETASRIAFNDVVFTRGALSRMIALSVSVGGEFVARFNADGLIIATPTGSTAYNLSSAGPIVHPDVNALVLTPIAPHILTNRPVVIPASADILVQPLFTDAEQVFVTFDGETGMQLHGQDTVTVRGADCKARIVRATTRCYFQVLREKLKWAER